MKQVLYCQTCLPDKVVLSWGDSETARLLNHDDSGDLHQAAVFEVNEDALDGNGHSIWKEDSVYLVIAFGNEFV